MFEISFSQPSRLNSFSLLLAALLRLVQWFVWASYRVRLVLSVSLFSPDGHSWVRGRPVCWWLGWYLCFICCSDEACCTGCYWWCSDAGSCIPVVSFVWVLTVWYSLGWVLWWSRVLESLLPLQRFRAWSPPLGAGTVLARLGGLCDFLCVTEDYSFFLLLFKNIKPILNFWPI